ncbi:MAG: tetratricopeptide repeat protein [Candidatus Marinimicrobia bacterium]|nr:tetratricopeptide repeat protein [Candidatus Neomarinimicrobiota bacterium]
MYHVKNLLSSASVVAALILTLQVGCSKTQSGDLPITTSSEDARAAYLEGRHLAENLRANDARVHFQKAVEADPAFAMAYLQSAIIAPSPGEVFEYLDQAVERSGGVSKAEQQYIEAVNIRTRGDSKGALRLLRTLARTYPEDSRISLLIGLYEYVDLADEDEGAKWLKRSVASQTDYAPPLNMLGYLYLGQRNFDEAENYFKQQIDILPEEPNPHDSMGDMLSRAGRYEEAVNSYARAVELDPGFVLSQRNIGINLAWSGNYDAGRDAIMQAMDMAPTSAGKIAAQYAIARLYMYQNELAEALVASRKAITMSQAANLPASVANYEMMSARIYMRMDNPEQAAEAIAHCAKTIADAQLDESVTKNWWRQRLYEEADLASRAADFDLADAKTAALRELIDIEKNPGLMRLYHSAMGKVEIQRENYQSAVDHLLQANMNSPYDTYYLSRAYAGAGNIENAQELLERAVKWNADSQFYSLIRAEAAAALKGS